MKNIKFRAWDLKQKQWIDEWGSTFTSSSPREGQVAISFSGNLRVFYAEVLGNCKDIVEKKDDGHLVSVGNSEYESVHPVDAHYKSQYVLMQFTGLKDKNGKEIYEGDIVKDYGFGSAVPENERHNVGQVYQGKGGTWLWTRPNNEIDQIGGGETLLSVLQFNEAEVIGNIYENKDLLK